MWFSSWSVVHRETAERKAVLEAVVDAIQKTRSFTLFNYIKQRERKGKNKSKVSINIMIAWKSPLDLLTFITAVSGRPTWGGR